jgi:hypothetical protein
MALDKIESVHLVRKYVERDWRVKYISYFPIDSSSAVIQVLSLLAGEFRIVPGIGIPTDHQIESGDTTLGSLYRFNEEQKLIFLIFSIEH